jgi:pimeloyl-ACP methyl ester carboxylesterase
LSTEYTVAAVENYGYGRSDRTRRARTIGNIVEETRLALRECGITPPYALYYAHAYPEEVAAIVGLDTAVPGERAQVGPRKISTYQVLRALGVVRLALLFKPDMAGNATPDYLAIGRRMIRMMAGWNYKNSSLCDETANYARNVPRLHDDRYSTMIPITMIVSKTSVEQAAREIPGPDWVPMHADMIAGNTDGEFVLSEGTHYIHWINARRIAEIIKETIERKQTGTE